MKLTAKEDIDAPLDQVFAQISDANGIERAALRRGAKVTRSVGGDRIVAGEDWTIAGHFRGKRREAQARVIEVDPEQGLNVLVTAAGLEITTVLELVQLSRGRTRLVVKPDIKPKTLSARLLVQSLRLTRGSVERKFRSRVEDLATQIEDRARNA